MGKLQRSKGVRGELEAAALVRDLTGWDVQRRVRQHDGDSDLLGVPGWSVEVKRHKAAGRAQIDAWWLQTVEQATRVAEQQNGANSTDCIPVLLYRLDRQGWRAMWPLAVLLTQQTACMWSGAEWTADTSLQAWAAVARDVAAGQALREAA